MKIFFCILDAFEDNLKLKHILGKYLKESCRLNSREQFSFNYFPKFSAIGKISPK